MSRLNGSGQTIPQTLRDALRWASRSTSMRITKLSVVIVTTIASLSAFAQPSERPISESVKMDAADFGLYPTNYEELVKTWAVTNLKDPESARYGRISKPRKEWEVENLRPTYGFSVCADINARNSYGGYAGAQTYWFFIRDGRVARAQNTVGFPGKMISRDHFINCEDGANE